MKNCTYQLQVNSEQAKAIIEALDLFSRIGMGQIEEVSNFTMWHSESQDYSKQDKIRNLCNEIKVLLGHPVNGSCGIAQEKVPKVCRVAYDIQCVLRQKVAQAENEGKHSVWHHDPLHLVKDVPLAKCSIV